LPRKSSAALMSGPFPGGERVLTDLLPKQNYKFTGKERDTESGLDYFGARYYSSRMGRWLTPDWANGAKAVPYADFGDPQSLNLYGYVGNQPVTRFDKDGHCPQCLGALFGAAAGAVTILYQTAHTVITGKGTIPTNREIAGAILGGAVGGAIGTGGGGGILTNVVTKGGVQVAKSTLTQTALQSGVGGVTGGVVNRAVSTGDGNKALDPKAVATDGAVSVGLRLAVAPLTSGSTVAQNANSLSNQYASPSATGPTATANLAIGDTARSMASQAAQRSAETGALVKTGTAAVKQAVKEEEN
jgi:RHS repeat-associated protein